MRRWLIKYCARPHRLNRWKNAIVEAETPELAIELLRHRLLDITTHGYSYEIPVAYQAPASRGRVISGVDDEPAYGPWG